MSTTRAAAEFPIEGSASLDLAKEHYERALEIEPGEWRAAVGIAKLMLMQGETSKALKTLDSYLKQDSERAEVQAMYGRICFQTQDYAQAKRYLSYAYNQRPALPFLAGDLGYLYLVTGEHSTALKLLRIAHQRQPSDLHFFRLLAEAEFIKGNFHKAVDLYQQVSELVPEQSKTRNVLAWLLATCPYETKRDGAAAIDLIAPKPGQLIGKDPATLEIYAACFAEVGDFEKAIDFQQQAVDQVESLANPAYSKAQVKGMLSRLELFRSQQPYRTADTTQTPVAISSGTETNFQALRF
jgi:tetratricopeptide (TPR) repeat protein